MSSWAHRFGWIVPSWNTVTEFEVERLNPSGVSEHFTRIAHTEDTEAAFAHMAEEAPGAAQLLGHAGVDAICYACTSGSFFRGFEYDRDFEAQLSSAAGRPVMTMAYALVAGAEALGMEKVAVAAPYEPWLMERLVTFLEGGGLTVLKSAGLGHQANILYEPSKAIELAQSAWHPEADGLIMSCGNFRTLEAIDDIESLIGRPVVTSVQASLWGLLRLTGDERAIEGAGRLLREVPRLGRPAVESH
jgi:maleate isomerase